MLGEQLAFSGFKPQRVTLQRALAVACLLAELCLAGVARAQSSTPTAEQLPAEPKAASASPEAVQPDDASVASAQVPETPKRAAVEDTQGSGGTWGQFLQKVTPGIAKVGCKRRWFTGFVYHSRKHVITTREALNNECELSVRFQSGKLVAAHAVAWSDTDGLVLLELEAPAPSDPLTMTADLSAVREVGARLATVASTTDYDSGNQVVDAWLPPRLRFGVVGAAQEQQILLDLPSSYADLGAPVFAPDGTVAGIVASAYAVSGPSRVVTTEQIQKLLSLIGTQGEFSRSYPFGWTEGVLATPYSSRGLLGASIHMGPTYRWLALVLHAGIYQAGERRVSAAASEQQSAFRAEAELTARIHGQPGAYSLVGAGVAYESLATEHRLLDQDAHTTHKRRWRPFISALAGYWTGQFRFSAYPGPDPELRLEIGFTQGR